MGGARDWANLPGELAHLIADKLPPDLIYVLAFRAVCKHWRFSLPLSHLQPQLPWIIHRDLAYFLTDLCIYSLAGGDTGAAYGPMPERGDLACYGPGRGYLFLSSLKKNEHWLLNPLTGHLIPLKFRNHGFVIQSRVCGSLDLTHNNWHVLCCWSFSERIKFYIAAIYRANENAWKNIEIDLFSCLLSSTCCWDGKLFAIDNECLTMVFDVVSGKKLYEVPPVDGENQNPSGLTHYLVESCGDILRITRSFDTDATDEELQVSMFDIYKLYSQGGQHSLVEVTDIGNQMVFLDQNNGFTVSAPSGFKGNCIYFFLEDGSKPCRYDISTRTTEMLPCPFENYCTWFIPSLG